MKAIRLAMTNDMDTPDVNEYVFDDNLLTYMRESKQDVGTLASFRIVQAAMRAGYGQVVNDGGFPRFKIDEDVAVNVYIDNCIDIPLVCGVTNAVHQLGVRLTYWYYSAKDGKYMPMAA